MPRAIADSDDDDEDVVIHCGADDEVEGSGGKGLLGGATTASGSMGSGTNDASTGSTEYLRRQIQTAEQELISNPNSAKMAVSSSASPSVQTAKRRSTAAFGNESSPVKSSKCTKTMKTYGSERESRIAEDTAFEQLKDDAPAAMTSQFVRFSDHSHVQSSVALPSESFPADFVEHNPNTMFRDTGSTVADDSSTHQRLVEEALGSKKGLSTSIAKDDRSVKNLSSPFPWSASEHTKTPKSTRAPEPEGHQNAGEVVANNPQVESGANQDTLPDQSIQRRASQDAQIEGAASPHPNPVVEIPAVPKNCSTQKANKGRKRKTEQDDVTDPLNSEDRALGLPKERYKPRPSRRRATQVTENPIDYSVRPEKAAKVKRTKTVPSQPSKSSAIDLHPAATLETDGTSKSSASSRDVDPHQKAPNVADKAASVEHCIPDVSGFNNPAEEVEAPPKPVDETSPVVEQSIEDKIFVKPAKPTPKAKSTKKSKRAKTTIFEDHVDFTSSQRSPSLSQQQAKRQSALQDVPNDSGKVPQKRKSVVVEDDEDEDDSPSPKAAKDVEDDSPPKKRGRGRPPKPAAAAEPSVMAKENVPQQSEHDVEERPSIDNATKKRGRGRPSKSADETQPAAKDHSITAMQPPESVQTTENATTDTPALPPPIESDSAPAIPSATTIKTPSPEKSSPSKTKPSPTSHSPIKSSSKVPLRVGLSKKNRIPPLLRMTRPPKDSTGSVRSKGRK